MLAIMACMLFTAPASATVALITYTGHITDESFDGSGVFGGTPGGSLANDPFTILYTLDNSEGSFSSGCDADGCHQQISGDGVSIPLIADLTINGTTIHFSGANGSSDASSQSGSCTPYCSSTTQFVLSEGGNRYLQNNTGSTTNPILFPLSLIQPFDVAIDNSGMGTSGSGTFAFYNAGQETYGNFLADHVSLTIPGAVPEPASWALMIGGFGLVGGALRRSRQTPAAIFA